MKFSSPQPQDFLDPQNSLAWRETMTEKRNSNLPPDEASSNPHCFCYCQRAVDNTIIAYIVRCGNFSTLSGKYSRIVASSQRNHLGCAGRLCRSVVIGRSLSVVVIVLFRTMTTINFDRSNASSLKSMIDRGLG